ncbi:hypothetical protein [Vagococcus fluvialis]|uniref:Uncharacterized protein n=1 Tax=Vagococcus fluvialis bH819 TaxID=1255619 RepID=A0A1X6WRS3_9ENTE|nr:hypothetical protein [Vagococcus fluvialis]SLM86990.1 hypothetical protein FM121_12910 [Vagococcus fluvialis bH819]
MNERTKKLMDDLVRECQREGASCVVGVISGNSPVEIVTGGNGLDVAMILQIGMNSIVEATGISSEVIGNLISNGINSEGVLAYDM